MNKTFENVIAAGVEQYQQAKPEGDIDLVAMVRNKLLGFGLHEAVQNSFDTNRFIIEAQNKPSAIQRHLLNRYWALQLMSSTKPTTEERYCLIPNGTVEQWLDLFEKKVLPFVVENKLPVSI